MFKMIKLKLSKKYSKSIFYLTFSLLFVILFAFVSKNVFDSFSATYTNITTQVTVGNSAPTITIAPTESTTTLTGGTSDSCGGAATSGDTVTFKITGTDPNGSTHKYYLIVCSSDSVTPGVSGAAPTCDGTQFCVSSDTTSGSQASCTYNSSNTTTWSTSWYAFVCDNYTGGSLCSASSQGSGVLDSGSPLYVNHAPSFSASAISVAANPGSTFTWTTTSSDPDASPKNHIKLLVCKTTGLSAGACDGGAGDTWCSSAGTETSNSTCGYVATAPYADGAYNAYPYIVDECNLAASGGVQGTVRAFTVNNVAPSVEVGSVTLNGGSAISLTDGTTTAVSMTGIVSDQNGCRNQGNTADEISSVKGYAYRSAITYANCDTAGEANANNCYPEVSCSAGTCTDGITTYTCSASLQYYADPTDPGTPNAAQNWLNTIKATDDDAAAGSTQITTGVELTTLVGGETTPTSLDYGTLAVGQNITLTKQLTTSTSGNTGIDANVKAMSATMCTNYPTCTGGTPIAAGNQKYSLISGTTWAAGTAVTTSDYLLPLHIPKQTTSSPNVEESYWGIQIPSNILPGVYSGLIRYAYVAYWP